MTPNGFAPGTHLLIDFYQASTAALTNSQLIEEALRHAAHVCGATVLNVTLHQFSTSTEADQPPGITGVALLAESHISIHTWPEIGFAAIDIFMCGQCQPELAIEPLQQVFKPQKIDISHHARGQRNPLDTAESAQRSRSLSQ